MAEGGDENAPRPLPGVDLNLGPWGFSLKLATPVVLGGLALAAYYMSNDEQKEKIINVISSAVCFGTDRKLIGITPGSLIVEILCTTKESAWRFFDEYESGAISQRMREEFEKIGFENVTTELDDHDKIKWQLANLSVMADSGDENSQKSDSGICFYLKLSTSMVVGGLSLAAYYLSSDERKQQIINAISSAVLSGKDRTLNGITPEPFILEVHCSTQESAEKFFFEYDSATMSLRLRKELGKTGFNDVTIQFENYNEIKSRLKFLSHGSLAWQNSEKLNYSCLRTMVTDVCSGGLRKVFKQEWNLRFQTTLGAWDETTSSGQQLFHLEKARHKAKGYLPIFQSGDTRSWDCSALFDAILYSYSIGKSLNPVTKNAVNRLREIRNDVMHSTEGKMSDIEFQSYAADIEKAFKVLGLPIDEITEIISKKNRYISFQVLPSKPTHKIVKRSGTVSEVIDNLRRLYETNDRKLTYFYISGNPGSGKSQLARQVAEEFFSTIMNNPKGKYFVMTLNGRDLNSLFQSYQEFGRRLQCDETVLRNISESNENMESKILHLRSLFLSRIKNWSRWLVVVDNVENLPEISPLLPLPEDDIWENGQIIVTTQNSSAVPPGAGHKTISRGMTEEECRELLSSISDTESNDDVLNNVAKCLDYQPLAMSAAAVYLRRVAGSMSTKSFSWTDYLSKLDEGKLSLTEEELLKTNSAYSQTMTAAVLLAVKKAYKSDWIIRETAQLFSHISFEPLPFDIMFHYLHYINKNVHRDQVMLSIQQCSLFISDDDRDPEIRVHRVVHDAIKTFVMREMKFEAGTVINVARSLSLFMDPRNDQIKSVPHLKAFLFSACDACINIESWNETYSTREKEELFKIFQTLGDILDRYCEYRRAMEYFCLCVLFDYEGELPYKLGHIHCKLGEYQGAKQIFEQLLHKVKQLGSSHANIASCYNNLANVLANLGDLERAKEYHYQSLDIRLKVLGPNHVHVAFSYNNLASVLSDLGYFKRATEYYHRALDIRLKNWGPSHVHVAASYKNLASVLVELGELQQAKEYSHQALDITLKVLGPDHIDVASSYSILASVLQGLGDLQESKYYLDQALAIRLKVLGPNHIVVALSYNNLANVLRELGDLQQAKKYHLQALDMRLKVFGRNHVHVAKSYGNLACVFSNLGDSQQAKEYHRHALDILLKVVGPNHVDVATSYYNLAITLVDLGDLQQAKEYHRQALDLRLKVLGANHADVASSYNNLAIVLMDLGDLQRAKEYLHQALDIRLKVLAANHADVASSYNNLAIVLGSLGELQQAKAYHHQALDIRLKVLGRNHVDVALSYNNLAKVLFGLGDLQQARECLHRALDIRRKV